MQTPIPWKRFWVLRGETINLADGGYLYDPEGPYGSSLNPSAIPFDAISDRPCLALLAEPGMGKTTTLGLERDQLQHAIKAQGDDIVWLNLRAYGTEERLVRALFDSPSFVRWKKGAHRLHLFLDSFDEALLRVDTLAALLVDELRHQAHDLLEHGITARPTPEYPSTTVQSLLTERLFLRVICRTAEWPRVLETGLQELWGKEAVSITELAPLRRKDVALAAQVKGVDEAAFMGEIHRLETVPLAIKPVTLDFLLNMYRKQGTIVSTPTELYRDGCRLLCTETNEGRHTARIHGSFSPDQRLLAAGRIAAITIFTNRYAVWTDIDSGNVPPEDVTVADLLTLEERLGGTFMTEPLLRETLATGLFSARGDRRLGWSHQSYAEYLAAWYLQEQGVTSKQLLSLLVHPNDSDGRLVPQLHEAAVWISAMNPEVFSYLLNHEASVLLRSAAAALQESNRNDLVAALLLALAEGTLDRLPYDALRHLKHSRLPEQLDSYLRDPMQSQMVRHSAIEIALTCELNETQDTLIELALNPDEDYEIRVAAAHAVSRIGDSSARSRLRPLVHDKAGLDPRNDLCGYALKAMWPDSLAAEELFEVLGRPDPLSYLGAYFTFLNSGFVQVLRPQDLPVALEWIARQPSRAQLGYSYQRPINDIFQQAWDHFDQPGVLPALANAVLSRFAHFEPIVTEERTLHASRTADSFDQQLAVEPEKRRLLFSALVPSITSPVMDVSLLTVCIRYLLRTDDIGWSIEQLEHVDTETNLEIFATVVTRLYLQRRHDPMQQEIVFAACQAHPRLAEKLSPYWGAVELTSEEAIVQRQRYTEQYEFERQHERTAMVTPTPSARVQIFLERFEEGDLDAWWQLNLELTLEPNSRHYGDEFIADLQQLPGWRDASVEMRQRLEAAGAHYLLEYTPETKPLFTTNGFYRPAAAGYRALVLHQNLDSDCLAAMPAAVWERWAPVILWYPLSAEESGRALNQELAATAYQKAPDAVMTSLLQLIDKQNAAGESIPVMYRLEQCWDSRLITTLLVKAQDPDLAPQSLRLLLTELLERSVTEALEVAKSLVPLPPPLEGRTRERALAAAHALVSSAPSAGWPLVWGVIQQDTEFGRAIIESASVRERSGDSLLDHLDEIALASLYTWMVQQYPDRDRLGGIVRMMTSEDMASDWKDKVVEQLTARGTREAVAGLSDLVEQFPHSFYLRRNLLAAKDTVRRRTWEPGTPQEVLALIVRRDTRLVQSEHQLLEVLQESLSRLEAELQGVTPSAPDLWNEKPFRPKDENRLSDYVTRYLRNDLTERGIVVNREVEIRRAEGGNPGERTDIQVDAVRVGADASPDVITVVIEVKGCWHPELKKSMETQLVNRYLHDNHYTHGLYLVGWFLCTQWDDTDHRKQQTLRYAQNKDDLQEILDQQAKALSADRTYVRSVVLNARLR